MSYGKSSYGESSYGGPKLPKDTPLEIREIVENIWEKLQDQEEETQQWRRRTWLWRVLSLVISIVSFLVGYFL